MREIEVADLAIDSGPTVLTLRDVFDGLCASVGQNLDDVVTLDPLPILARHAWDEGAHFDLFADVARTEAEVARLFGDRTLADFRRFSARAAAVHASLADRFMRASQPGLLGLVTRFGLSGLPELMANRPFSTMWRELGRLLPEPRLRQLFARYATYCGCSPFDAPSTLMLIADVEARGVWRVKGGMQRLAEGLTKVAERAGVTIRYETPVAELRVAQGRVAGVRTADGEDIQASAVVSAADVGAIADGLFGTEVATRVRAPARHQRSLSAMTWSAKASSEGRPLAYHNVLFSTDYRQEFEQIFTERRVPDAPTVYVCAQQQSDGIGGDPHSPLGRAGTPPSQDLTADGTRSRSQSIFCLVNAPPDGDVTRPSPEEIARCTKTMQDALSRCGIRLTLDPSTTRITTPADFAEMFPGTGGALYGRATHGPFAAFRRSGSKTALPGLYLAGGSVHPGAGVPMAALSGRLAASQLMADRASTRQYHPAGISGGMSTPSVATAATD